MSVLEHLLLCKKELAALRAEVERLREERRWIPVEERLPPANADVLCAVAGWGSFSGSFQHGSWFREGVWLEKPPTHWQPLPAPPVEEE